MLLKKELSEFVKEMEFRRDSAVLLSPCYLVSVGYEELGGTSMRGARRAFSYTLKSGVEARLHYCLWVSNSD